MGKKDKKRTKKARAATTSVATSAPLDPSVLHRIYDVLETGNHKTSLKLITACISKHGELDILLTLKALVFQRQGKFDEASQVAEIVRKREPTDTTVLSTLRLTYKHMNKMHEIVQSYEAASRKDPKNEELMCALFHAYGRMYAYDKQQQCAMTLYTKLKNPKYLFWSATNWLLLEKQKNEEEDKGTSNKMLHLAHMMIMRGIKKDAVVQPKELLVLVELLKGQGKYIEALSLLNGPHGELFRKDHMESGRAKCELLLELKQFKEAAEGYQALIDPIESHEGNPDDWFFLRSYLKCQFIRMNEDSKNTEDLLKDTRSVIAHIQEDEKAQPNMRRGPFLIELELEAMLINRKQEGANKEQLINLIVSYFSLFGTKNCFFNDVQDYLSLLDEGESMGLCAHLSELSLKKDNTPKQQEYEWKRAVTIAQIKRYLNTDSEANSESLIVLALQLYDKYEQSGLVTTGQLEPTERGIGDVFVQLCAFALMESFELKQTRTTLLEAIVVLEYALQKCSKFNFQWRLLLIRLYNHPKIGAFQCALVHYNALGIKNIQNDSMTHFIMSDCVRYGFFTGAEALARRVISFHHGQQKEIPDYFKLAYRNENYLKVAEFDDLRHRLRRSLQLQICLAEHNHMSLISLKDKTKKGLASIVHLDKKDELRGYLTTDSEKLNESLTRLVANSDFSVVSCWETSKHERGRPRVSQFNRPALSIYRSSWHVPEGEELKQPEEDEPYSVGRVSPLFLRLRRLLFKMRVETIQSNNAVSLTRREQVTELLTLCRELGFIQEDEQKEKVLEEPNEITYNLVFHSHEITASIAECAHASTQWLESLVTEVHTADVRQQQLDQHTARWQTVQRSFVVISSLLIRAREKILPKTLRHVNLDIFNSDSIPEISLFLREAADTLMYLLKVWSDCIPSRKTLRKRKGKAEGEQKEFEDRAIEVLGGVRAAAKAVADTLQHLLTDLVSELTRGETEVKDDDGEADDIYSKMRKPKQFVSVFKHLKEDQEFTDEVVAKIDESIRMSCSSLKGVANGLIEVTKNTRW